MGTWLSKYIPEINERTNYARNSFCWQTALSVTETWNKFQARISTQFFINVTLKALLIEWTSWGMLITLNTANLFGCRPSPPLLSWYGIESPASLAFPNSSFSFLRKDYFLISFVCLPLFDSFTNNVVWKDITKCPPG